MNRKTRGSGKGTGFQFSRRKFHTATDAEISDGLTTDVYFKRAVEILKARGKSREVKAEFSLKGLPHGYDWGVFAGLEECLNLLKGVPITLKAVPEGTVIRLDDPVMTIIGDYVTFAELETPLLGLICQASGVATKAARLRISAGDRMLISFGARRMHPAISPMIERNAYIGGCDGVATVLAASILGIKPTGTIPHALVILMGGVEQAIAAFDSVVDPDVRRIALVDTFGDERFEALAACEAIGDRLYGVRLDTPRSRRGSIREIVKEVRWELGLRGYNDKKIFVSGGVDESAIKDLKDIVDGFGVGTCLSNAPVLDFAMDIVEVEGRNTSKRGKMSGEKVLLRCEACLNNLVLPVKASIRKKCSCGGRFKVLTQEFIRSGEIVKQVVSPQEIRKKVIDCLSKLSL